MAAAMPIALPSATKADPAADHLPDDEQRLLTQRDADSVLAGAADHVVRDDAVDAHGAEHERQAREQRQQRHDLPGRSERQIEDVLHRRHLLDRELRALPGDRRTRVEQYRGMARADSVRRTNDTWLYTIGTCWKSM